MLVAAVKTNRASAASGKSSQLQAGSTPKASRKTRTTIRLRPRLKSAGEDGRERDHQPRELGLADDPLLGDDRGDRVGGRFLEEGEEDDAEQQHHRVVLDFVAADSEDFGEDEQQHAEEHQRPDQRPQVAEDRAEVDALELGDRDQPEQVEEAPRAAAERRRAPHLAQLRRRRRVRSGARRSSPLVLERDLDRRAAARPCPGSAIAAVDVEVQRLFHVEDDRPGVRVALGADSGRSSAPASSRFSILVETRTRWPGRSDARRLRRSPSRTGRPRSRRR